MRAYAGAQIRAVADRGGLDDRDGGDG